MTRCNLIKVHNVCVLLSKRRAMRVSTAGGDGGARGEEAHTGAERTGEKERRREGETSGTERGRCKYEIL